MPLYEYECRKCHHRFERIQKFSDPLVRKCPKCKAGRVQKLISAPAVQFKGTGWYVTDYAGKKGGDEKEGGQKGEGGGKSEADASSGGKDASEKSSGSGKKASDKGASGKSSSSGGKSSKS